MLKFNMRYDYTFYRKHTDVNGKPLECPTYAINIKTTNGELFMEEWEINNMIRFLKYYKTSKGKTYLNSDKHPSWEQILRSVDYKE